MVAQQDTVLTIPEVARKLRIGKNTVYKMLNSGEIPSVRCGNRWRIPAKALENWLINHD